MWIRVDDPYVWDKSYQVHHNRLDDKHLIIFNLMQELGEIPADVDLLNRIKRFTGTTLIMRRSGSWPPDADTHKKKYNILIKTLTKWVNKPPVSQEYVAFAKNWLDHHTKNTDCKYRYKLATQHKTPEPDVLVQ